MDHQKIVADNSVERYVLGEMTVREVQLFEEHYFGCEECASDIRAASALFENARAVLTEPVRETAREAASEPPARPRRSPWWWFDLRFAVPAFAAMALLVIVGYQNVTLIPQLEAVRTMTPPVIMDGTTTRANLAQIHSGQPLEFTLPRKGALAGDRISVRILNHSDKIVRTGSIVLPDGKESFTIYFPGALPADSYTLTASAADDGETAELIHGRFDIIP